VDWAVPFTCFSSPAKQQKIELGAFLVSDAAQNSYIFLFFLHITKASHRLTPYRLKDKKGVSRLESPSRLKNYGW
jgi:hypothetical protein